MSLSVIRIKSSEEEKPAQVLTRAQMLIFVNRLHWQLTWIRNLAEALNVRKCWGRNTPWAWSKAKDRKMEDELSGCFAYWKDSLPYMPAGFGKSGSVLPCYNVRTKSRFTQRRTSSAITQYCQTWSIKQGASASLSFVCVI